MIQGKNKSKQLRFRVQIRAESLSLIQDNYRPNSIVMEAQTVFQLKPILFVLS